MCERPLPPQRRPGSKDTRDHAHASHLKGGGQDGHPHRCPHHWEAGGTTQGEGKEGGHTLAEAGKAGTMEGCGVLF